VYLYVVVVVVQREQAEREQDWEQEQQEKREALEAAQRELEEVLNCNSALLCYCMICYTSHIIVKATIF
jgi:predicted component of type VI protein secretion system